GPDRGGREIAQGLADAGARLRQQHVRQAATRARGKHAPHIAGIATLPLAPLRARAGEPFEPRFDLIGGDLDLRGLRAFGRFLPFGKLGKQPFLGAIGLGDVRQEHVGPGPAQAGERLQRAPCALALRPVGALARLQQRAGGFLEQRGDRVVAGRLGQAQGVRQTLGSGHDEARGMDEGVELEEVEPRKVRIAEPRRDERCVQDQQRSIRRGHDRFALADRARRAVGGLQPGSGVAGVERGEGKRGHRLLDARRGTKSKRGSETLPQPSESEPDAGLVLPQTGTGRSRSRILKRQAKQAPEPFPERTFMERESRLSDFYFAMMKRNHTRLCGGAPIAAALTPTSIPALPQMAPAAQTPAAPPVPTFPEATPPAPIAVEAQPSVVLPTTLPEIAPEPTVAAPEPTLTAPEPTVAAPEQIVEPAPVAAEPAPATTRTERVAPRAAPPMPATNE